MGLQWTALLVSAEPWRYIANTNLNQTAIPPKLRLSARTFSLKSQDMYIQSCLLITSPNKIHTYSHTEKTINEGKMVPPAGIGPAAPGLRITNTFLLFQAVTL